MSTKGLLSILAAAIVGTLISPSALAISSYVSDIDAAAKSLYGPSASHKYSCNSCHASGYSVSGGTQWMKDFTDAAIKLNLSAGKLSATQVKSVISGIATLDSDKDGATNQAELTAGTDPSNAASKPVVTPPPPTCTLSAPSISLSPLKQAGDAGATLTYSLNVKNNDSSGCASNTIQLQATVPSALSSQLAMQSVALAPGASSAVSLKLMSGVGSAPGDYAFIVKAVNAASTNLMASVSGAYTVNAPVTVPVCTRAAPAVSISPASQSGMPGQSLSYKIAISNKDSSACSASVFSVSATLSANLSGKLFLSSVNVAAGQSATVDLPLISAVNAPVGEEKFSIQVSDAIVVEHTAQAGGSYIVKAPVAGDTQAPTVPADLKQGASKRSICGLSWTASTDDVGVVKYLIYLNGSLRAESTTPSAKIRLRRGHNEIQVSAVDAAGNESAKSTVVSIDNKRDKRKQRAQRTVEPRTERERDGEAEDRD